MKKITTVICISLLFACNQKPQSEIKLVRNLDSVTVKAHIKGAHVATWTATLFAIADSMQTQKDTAKLNLYKLNLKVIAHRIDSVFSDSTLNPIFKK